jgi:hypothetical protein
MEALDQYRQLAKNSLSPRATHIWVLMSLRRSRMVHTSYRSAPYQSSNGDDRPRVDFQMSAGIERKVMNKNSHAPEDRPPERGFIKNGMPVNAASPQGYAAM